VRSRISLTTAAELRFGNYSFESIESKQKETVQIMRAITKSTVTAIALLALSSMPAQSRDSADPDYVYDTSNVGRSNGYIMSDQLLELGMVSADGLRLEGEQAIRLGHTDRACLLLQKALEMSPGDMDGRILYASALEKKLMKQKAKKRDPKLYNFCVKNWYYIWKKTDFHDQKAQARNHLEKLCGTLPKWHEKPHKYLSRVLIPEDGSVKVSFGNSKKIEKTE
jgi:hypothetical protein